MECWHFFTIFLTIVHALGRAWRIAAFGHIMKSLQ